MKNKICHITTVHPREDVRIFHKECISLSKNYNTHLIVADGKGDEVINNIHIIDIGLRQSSRLQRAKIDSKKALKKALDLDCYIYHFHDPELIKIGEKLKRKGKKVIYDVHEDLPRQIMGKPYLNKAIKPILARILEWQENKAAKKFDYICTATPFIRDRFLKINKNTIDINNYPILNNTFQKIKYSSKKKEICYIGGIAQYRGVFELIDSLQYSEITLNLAGEFETLDFEKKCRQSKGWKYVNFYGFVSRQDITGILNQSRIGIVTLYPLINYLDSLPVKMFEYMSAALPVIASDFPFWVKIINDNKCGININPLNSEEIANSVINLINKPKESERLGKNGQKAVIEKFNWTVEENKLLNLYNNL